MGLSERRSLLCPNCRYLISADEPSCPHCGIKNPGSWWKGNAFIRELGDGERLLKRIIAVNAALYVFTLLLSPWMQHGLGSPFSFLSPSNQALVLAGATGTLPIDGLHRWWTLLSANYLHGGIFHILFNMLALWQIAPWVLREYGAYRMFSVYTLSGILGYLLSYAAGVTLTIGASAAVCGMIGAALYFGFSRGGDYGRAVFRQTGTWAVMIFLFGFLVPGINNWGHGGGLLAGAVLGWLLGYKERTAENLFHKALAAVCALVTLGVLSWAVLTASYYRFFM